MYIKLMDPCIKMRVLTLCCCAGSGEEGVMEDIKRDKCVHEVDKHMNQNKSIFILTSCCCVGSEENVMEDINMK